MVHGQGVVRLGRVVDRDPDQQAVGEQAGQARSRWTGSAQVASSRCCGTAPSASRTTASSRPRHCRSVPAHVCTLRAGPSYAGWPAARQAHRSAIGQRGQDGFVGGAHQGAELHHRDRPGRRGRLVRRAAAPVARSRSARVTAVAGNSTPLTARAKTRRTLVSSTTWRRPKANDAIAAAV